MKWPITWIHIISCFQPRIKIEYFVVVLDTPGYFSSKARLVMIWGDKAHLGVDVIWDSVSGSAVLHDLLPLKGTWKCQNVTACPCEKHCSVGFGPFPQTPYTFEVSTQSCMTLFYILHTLLMFLVTKWKMNETWKCQNVTACPCEKHMLSWIWPFSAFCIQLWRFLSNYGNMNEMWKCQNVTACPCKSTAQLGLALFRRLLTLLKFLAKIL